MSDELALAALEAEFLFRFPENGVFGLLALLQEPGDHGEHALRPGGISR